MQLSGSRVHTFSHDPLEATQPLNSNCSITPPCAFTTDAKLHGAAFKPSHDSSPPFLRFHRPRFQLPAVHLGPQAGDPPSDACIIRRSTAA